MGSLSIGYLNPPPGQSSCQFVSVPDVVGLPIAEAKSILTSMGMAGTIFDQDAMTTLAQVPDDVVVLQQDPLAGNQVCRMSEIQYRIDLVVDLAAPMVTTSLPLQTTPTVLIVGDSLSAEYGLARGTGWIQLMSKQASDEKISVNLVNASISSIAIRITSIE